MATYQSAKETSRVHDRQKVKIQFTINDELFLAIDLHVEEWDIQPNIRHEEVYGVKRKLMLFLCRGIKICDELTLA
jgi:hypothetical protein